jgi:hypothetical protein
VRASRVHVDELQQRVTFRFGAATDVRYLREVPEVGDFVSHRNELWMVSRVEADSVGTLVICDNPGSTRGHLPDSPAHSSNAGIPSGNT